MIMPLPCGRYLTSDFMTAVSTDPAWEVLGKVTSRIVNEVKGVNRVWMTVRGSRRRRLNSNNILEPRNAYFTGFLGSFYVW